MRQIQDTRPGVLASSAKIGFKNARQAPLLHFCDLVRILDETQLKLSIDADALAFLRALNILVADQLQLQFLQKAHREDLEKMKGLVEDYQRHSRRLMRGSFHPAPMLPPEWVKLVEDWYDEGVAVLDELAAKGGAPENNETKNIYPMFLGLFAAGFSQIPTYEYSKSHSAGAHGAAVRFVDAATRRTRARVVQRGLDEKVPQEALEWIRATDTVKKIQARAKKALCKKRPATEDHFVVDVNAETREVRQVRVLLGGQEALAWEYFRDGYLEMVKVIEKK